VRTHHFFDAENHNHAFSTTGTSKPTTTNWRQKHIVAKETSSAFAVSSKGPASNYSTTALPQQNRNGQPHIGIRNISSQKRLPWLDDLCKWIDSNLLDHGINAIRIALRLHRRLFFSDVLLWFLLYILHGPPLTSSKCPLPNAHEQTTSNQERPIQSSGPALTKQTNIRDEDP
jgi:hypothetical protein